MYSLIGLPEDIIESIREKISKGAFYIVCQGNTLYDKFIAKEYKAGEEAYIKLGVNCASECDYIVRGDYICRIFFSPELKKNLNKFKRSFKSVRSLNLQKLFDIMFREYKTPHVVVVEKIPEIAERIRKSTMKLFESGCKSKMV